MSEDTRQRRIELSPPWLVRGNANVIRTIEGSETARCTRTGGLLSEAADAEFVKERTRLHEAYIHETEKTKRLGYGLAAALLALSCLVPVFAPAGRETTSWWVSFALFVFAAGSAGYTNIWLKTKEREISLKSDSSERP